IRTPSIYSFPTRRSSDLLGVRLGQVRLLRPTAPLWIHRRCPPASIPSPVRVEPPGDIRLGSHRCSQIVGESRDEYRLEVRLVPRSEEHTSELQSQSNLVC